MMMGRSIHTPKLWTVEHLAPPTIKPDKEPPKLCNTVQMTPCSGFGGRFWHVVGWARHLTRGARPVSEKRGREKGSRWEKPARPPSTSSFSRVLPPPARHEARRLPTLPRAGGSVRARYGAKREARRISRSNDRRRHLSELQSRSFAASLRWLRRRGDDQDEVEVAWCDKSQG
jgi:hypothetical protein